MQSCEQRNVRLVKELKNGIMQVLDNSDYLGNIMWVSKGMSGGE